MRKVKKAEDGAVMFIDGRLSTRKEPEFYETLLEGDGRR